MYTSYRTIALMLYEIANAIPLQLDAYKYSFYIKCIIKFILLLIDNRTFDLFRR